MQTNLLVNPFLPFTLEDLLFEKQSVHEPIANNTKLSAARRSAAMQHLVCIEQVLDLFEAAIAHDIDVEDKTGIDVIEEVYGKSIDDLRKGEGLADKAGQIVASSAKTAKGWLNTMAEWVVEKTK